MGQQTRLSKNNTKLVNEGHTTTVILHNTAVVKVDYAAKTVTYNTGGWLTATTISRMNQASNQLNLPYRLSRAKGMLNGYNIITGEAFSTDNNSITLGL